jgi:hypothetical protein
MDPEVGASGFTGFSGVLGFGRVLGHREAGEATCSSLRGSSLWL